MESLWAWAGFAFGFLPAARFNRDPVLNRRARVSEAAGTSYQESVHASPLAASETKRLTRSDTEITEFRDHHQWQKKKNG